MVVRGSPCVLALVAGFASTAMAQTMFVVNGGSCTIVDSGACIQSDNYPSNYATGAGAPTTHCDVDVNNNYDLFVTAFDVQAGSGGGSCDQDYVRLSDGSTNMDYCNTDNPLSAGGVLSMAAFMCGANMGASACNLKFFSDGSTTAGGWKLCQYSPPKPPPPSKPSPPMSPPAPKPPGVLCENTCLDKDNKVNSNTAYMRNDGYCSDGGKSDSSYDAQALAKWGGNSGLEYNSGCKLGTDCAGACTPLPSPSPAAVPPPTLLLRRARPKMCASYSCSPRATPSSFHVWEISRVPLPIPCPCPFRCCAYRLRRSDRVYHLRPDVHRPV